MSNRTAATFRSVLAGIAGFVVYGGWAYFVNQPYGTDMGLMAGFTQGSYSFVLTLSTTFLMEHLLLLLAEVPAKRVLTVCATSVITLGTAWLIHFFVGTPEVWLTILPGFAIGTIYTISYVMAITGLQKTDTNHETISDSPNHN